MPATLLNTAAATAETFAAAAEFLTIRRTDILADALDRCEAAWDLVDDTLLDSRAYEAATADRASAILSEVVEDLQAACSGYPLPEFELDSLEGLDAEEMLRFFFVVAAINAPPQTVGEHGLAEVDEDLPF